MSPMTDKQKEAQLAAFYAGEYQNMTRYLRRRSQELSLMEIEDIIGDLMLSLFEREELSNSIEDLAAYIYRALGHRLIDWLRKRKRSVSLEEDKGSGGGQNSNLPSSRGDADREASTGELRHRLVSALDALPGKQRAVWLATELEGHTFVELTRMWNEPLGTLLARKHRATEALRQALSDVKI